MTGDIVRDRATSVAAVFLLAMLAAALNSLVSVA